MPKMMQGAGKQVKIWLPQHIIDALRQDAMDAGERHIQPIARHILGQHYQRQARGAGLDVQIEPPHPAG